LRTGKRLLVFATAYLMFLSALTLIHPASAQTPAGVRVFLRPGVEDPYHPGWSQTLGTLWDHPEEVVNRYLDYAILASTDQSPSIGDLQFDVAIDNSYYGSLQIYVPPEFVFLDQTGKPASNLPFNVWTDATNDYNFISVGKQSDIADVAPGWTQIQIGKSSLQADADPLRYVTWDPGLYHVRLFNVKAPMEAGVYHFKIVMGSFFDISDFPIIIVKTELNPAYVTGKIALCVDEPCTIFDTSRYGRAWLEGTTPDGRSVKARYYFSPNDVHDEVMYDYWIFGAAPGTYTIKASAGGYPESSGERTTVTMGQSQHLKPICLNYGPTVDVTVWSKHGRGSIPWASLWQPPYGTNDPTVLDLNRPRPIRVDLYDGDGNWLTGVCGKPGGWWTVPPFRTPACAYYPRPSLNNPAVIGKNYPSTDPLSDNYAVTIGPDIQLDGSAPATSPKFVNGLVEGKQYKIGAYVTGYVMTDDDAWQRTFQVAGGTHVEMDLRRSNWFAVTLHIDSSQMPTVPTTLVLTATDTKGVERGDNSLLLAGNMIGLGGNPGDLLLWDAPAYHSGFTCPTCGFGPQSNPNTGASYNIGANPIILEGYSYRYAYDASERRAESVEEPGLRDYGFQPGTYDIGMHMADMGDPTGVIYYGNIPIDERQPYFTQGVGWYTIREGDPHSGSVALCNSPSTMSFRVRTNSLTLMIRSVDWQSPAHPRPWTFPGAEIGIDILDANTGSRVERLKEPLWGVVQDDGTIGSPYVVTHNPECMIHTNAADLSACLTVRYTGTDLGVFNGYGPNGFARFAIGAYPTSIAPGRYDYGLNTYGYVARGASSLYGNALTLGGDADIQVDLIQGGQIRVVMDFKKEQVGVAFDGWVRVEVFSETDSLVGASIYGMADPNPLAPGSYEPYNPAYDWKKASGEPAEGAGNDQAPEFGYGQRAYISHYFYGRPADTYVGYYASSPIDAHKLAVPAGETTAFDVYGFYNYFGGKSSRNDGLWANGWETTIGTQHTDHGLAGSKDIPGVTGGGLYKVKVWAFDPTTMDSYQMAADVTNVELPWGGATNVYVELDTMGRLAGTASWTDMYGDVRAMPWLQISASGEGNTVLASTTPLVFDPTTSIMASDPAVLASAQGYYMWLSATGPATYDVNAEATVAPQVFSAPGTPFSVSISPGFAGSHDIGVTPTGVPVPEFTTAPLVALSALAASLYLLRRRRK
jgi:hypothetical protein